MYFDGLKCMSVKKLRLILFEIRIEPIFFNK